MPNTVWDLPLGTLVLLLILACALIYYSALPENPKTLFCHFFFSLQKYIFNLFVQSWRTTLLSVGVAVAVAVGVGVVVGVVVCWAADRC